MAIKSHYGIAQAGGVDTAKLNARTSHGSDTKMYFPCEEGAGVITTEFSNEGFVLDSAADVNITIANGAKPNSMSILHWDAANNGLAPSIGNITAISPLGNSFVMFIGLNVVSVAALAAFRLGGAGGNVMISDSLGDLSFSDGTTSAKIDGSFGASAGSDNFVALVVDRENGIFDKYTAVTSKVNKSVAKAIPAAMGDITFDNLIQVSVSAGQNVYGMGLRAFPNGVPSTIQADLTELWASMKTKNGALPVNWLVNQ